MLDAWDSQAQARLQNHGAKLQLSRSGAALYRQVPPAASRWLAHDAGGSKAARLSSGEIMHSQKAANPAGSGKGRPTRPPKTLRALPAQGQVSPKGDALLYRKYRGLIRKHLGSLLDPLFAELTGVHFHVAWASAAPRQWAAQIFPTGSAVCCRLSGSPWRPECRTCGPKQLARALGADGEGHRFTCRLGVRNYWLPIRVRGETLGIAYLQALHHDPGKTPARPRSVRAEARALSGSGLARAGRLLHLIVEHVETASLADLRKADLTSASHALLALEKEQVRLHESLQRHLPPTPQTACHARPESHPEQLVHRLLECIEQDYAKPITLHSCAGKLGMNPAYLSALFSKRVGVPFKTYLTERRLDKAKALLGDPAKAAAEVAYSVGYASENRFRIAFKKATGLPPRLWRATMQTHPLPD